MLNSTHRNPTLIRLRDEVIEEKWVRQKYLQLDGTCRVRAVRQGGLAAFQGIRSGGNYDVEFELRACSGRAPTLVDKFLDIAGVKSQGTPARSHLDSRKIRLTLPGGVLDHPGNTDSELQCDILGLNQLADWGNLGRKVCRDTAGFGSVHTLHIASLQRSHDSYLQQDQGWVK
jgi:hypothetical protein